MQVLAPSARSRRDEAGRERRMLEVNAARLFLTVSLSVSSLMSCAEAPQLYWMKYGVTDEQIELDDEGCVYGAAERYEFTRHDTDFFHFSPIDQSRYRACMEAKGYRLVKEDDLLPPQPTRVEGARLPAKSRQAESIEQMCRRVTGEVGDADACIRWMNSDAEGPLPDAGSPAPADQSTAPVACPGADTRIHIRSEPGDSKGLRPTLECKPASSAPSDQ